MGNERVVKRFPSRFLEYPKRLDLEDNPLIDHTGAIHYPEPHRNPKRHCTYMHQAQHRYLYRISAYSAEYTLNRL